ncbi:hypothetical protein KC360_g160 [Hortaea werneckii]|nr:hypothetical protein KC344_g162 [Hortaea werneckii]KAI7180489.1 hypothetical protein KC360_g160 [Hortaea werneckii]
MPASPEAQMLCYIRPPQDEFVSDGLFRSYSLTVYFDLSGRCPRETTTATGIGQQGYQHFEAKPGRLRGHEDAILGSKLSHSASILATKLAANSALMSPYPRDSNGASAASAFQWRSTQAPWIAGNNCFDTGYECVRIHSSLFDIFVTG